MRPAAFQQDSIKEKVGWEKSNFCIRGRGPMNKAVTIGVSWSPISMFGSYETDSTVGSFLQAPSLLWVTRLAWILMLESSYIARAIGVMTLPLCAIWTIYPFPRKFFYVPVFISTFLVCSPLAYPTGINFKISPKYSNPISLVTSQQTFLYYSLLQLMHHYLLLSWIILDLPSSYFPHLISPQIPSTLPPKSLKPFVMD